MPFFRNLPIRPSAHLPILLTLLAACARAPEAAILIYGRVWTGDSAKPWAAAVAIAGDSILAVGDSADLARLAGKNTEVLSNGEGLVTPGFKDSHTHFIDGGFQLASVDLRDASTPEEFTARIKAFAAERRPGEWILGGNWDHERWPGAMLPRKEWIDSVTPSIPVVVDRLDGHMALANSAALRAAGISRATKDVAGGEIVRDPRTGEPTGIFKDNAQTLLYAAIPAPGEAQLDAALGRAMAHAASEGVTAVDNVSVPVTWLGAWQRARAAGALTVRAKLFFPIDRWRWVADTVARIGPGDDWLRIDGVKGYMDGSLGSTTALFDAPYNDAPRTSGLLTTPVDVLESDVRRADSAGLQVVVHAIGDRANGLLLDVYDRVFGGRLRERRPRIEHAQHLRPADLDRIARMGVILSMQPYHVIDDGRWAEKRIGPERLKTTYAFRALLDRNVVLAFGSDWSVAPLDPLLGIYAAVTRRTLDGKHPEGWVPEQRITVEEALRAYTSAGAFASFAEGTRGRLAPGMKADVVLIDRDLTRIPAAEIEQATIRTTIVGGKVVYRQGAGVSGGN
jgi:predicted amidohydrolase YtcJ